MPRQIADDPGRQVRRVWTGATSLRWPWDWTFQEWAVGAAAFVFGGILLAWVLPAGLVAGFVAYRFARWASNRTAPDAPRTHFRLILGALVVLGLLVSLNPLFWIGPLPLVAAAAGSLVLPWVAVRRLGPYLNWNRPISYWLRVPMLVARGPRLQPEDEIDPARLGLGLDLNSASTETGPIEPGVVVPVVKAKALPAVARVSPVEKRLVPLDRPKRNRIVSRTPEGFQIGKTEFRIEGRY